MELVPVGPDLYACLQPDTGWGASNSGLVDRGGGLMVDTFWDLPRTRALLGRYAEVRPDPPARLVNTHSNGDHCWGNQLLAERGTEIIGHRLCAEGFTHEVAPELLASLAAADPAGLPPGYVHFAEAMRAFDFTGITLTPPTTLIDGDTTLDLDGLRVDLLWVGPAHTPGDVVVHVPEHGVVFTGDVLFHRCTPLGWMGTFAQWDAALARIAALEPATVVAGHGPLATVEGLNEMRSYLSYVREEAAAGHRAGLSPLDAARRIELGRYAGWTEPERLAFQVHRAYRELDGVGWDTPVDVNAVFGDLGVLRQEYAAAP
jgi:glyoxylase-like metal-dependent hydrolase (beta-lactamase superfamily II)